MTLDFESQGLVSKGGIWYADNKAFVSYPDDGNAACFQIEDHSFWFRHRNNCIVELVKKYHKSGAFYDVGGGNGYVAKGLQDAGFETVLIEPGEKGCINAAKRNIKNVICATAEDAGFKENTLPAIGVFDVVEHFDDDVALLRSLFKFLKKDGLLFMTVPAYEMLWSSEDDYAGHFHRYTLSGLQKKLQALGFEIVFDTYIFSILPLPVLLFRSLPSRLGIKKVQENADNAINEHKKESAILSKVWNWETEQMKKGKKIPIGGSCLVVARKK